MTIRIRNDPVAQDEFQGQNQLKITWAHENQNSTHIEDQSFSECDEEIREMNTSLDGVARVTRRVEQAFNQVVEEVPELKFGKMTALIEVEIPSNPNNQSFFTHETVEVHQIELGYAESSEVELDLTQSLEIPPKI